MISFKLPKDGLSNNIGNQLVPQSGGRSWPHYRTTLAVIAGQMPDPARLPVRIAGGDIIYWRPIGRPDTFTLGSSCREPGSELPVESTVFHFLLLALLVEHNEKTQIIFSEGGETRNLLPFD